eukprot:gene28720-34671_t
MLSTANSRPINLPFESVAESLTSDEQIALSKLEVPIAHNEEQRIVVTRQILAIHTSASRALHGLVNIAKKTFKVDMAAISIVDLDQARSLYTAGFGGGQCHRSEAVCSFTILGDSVYVVPDCDKWYRHSPRCAGKRASGLCNCPRPYEACEEDVGLAVKEYGIRFYAGAPISLHGKNIGALCLMHTAPIHSFSKDDEHTLHTLRTLVCDILTHQHDMYALLAQESQILRQRVCRSLAGPVRFLTRLSGSMHLYAMLAQQNTSVSDGDTSNNGIVVKVGSNDDNNASNEQNNVLPGDIHYSPVSFPLLAVWEQELQRVGKLVEHTIADLTQRKI